MSTLRGTMGAQGNWRCKASLSDARPIPLVSKASHAGDYPATLTIEAAIMSSLASTMKAA